MQDIGRDNYDFQRPTESCPKNYKPWVWTLLVMMVVTVLWTLYENYQGGGFMRQLVEKDDGLKMRDFSNMYSTAAIESGAVKNVQNSYHNIIEKVRPAVISIDAVLGKPLTNANDIPLAPGVVEPNFTRVGSGVIIEPRGYVLSSLHVIAGADSLKATVHTQSGAQVYPINVVNVDKNTDLVLLRIQGDGPFPYAILGDSDNAHTGDIVLAMGSPFGFDQTATVGIISSTKRTVTINGKLYENLLQTDTPINKGNSGGPLIDAEGNVIGINNAIYSPNGVFTGIGFALPINQADSLVAGVIDFGNSPVQAVAGQIVAWGNRGRQVGNSYRFGNGQVITPPHTPRGRCITCHPQLCQNLNPIAPFHPIVPGQPNNNNIQNVGFVKQELPFLGVSVIDVDSVVAEHFGLLYPTGVLVERVYDKTPANDAGVLRSDIIMRVDGRRVRSAVEFMQLIQSEKIGKTFDLLIYRSGSRKAITINTVQFPTFENQPLKTNKQAFAWLGSEITDLNATLKPYIKNGVYVKDADGILNRAGVMRGDVIVGINGSIVQDITSFITIANATSVLDGIKLDILRSGQNISINVTPNVGGQVKPAAYVPDVQSIAAWPVAAQLTIPAPPVANNMKEFEWQGSEISPINSTIAPYIPYGVMVADVGGILRRNGVMSGDIIVGINGAKVTDIGSFIAMTNNLDLRDGALLDILRQGQQVYVTVKRGSAFTLIAGGKANTAATAPAAAKPKNTEVEWLGSEFGPINQALSAYIKAGVYVLDPGGVLKRSGVQKGDVLVAINDYNISDIDFFANMIKNIDVKTTKPTLEIIRSGQTVQVEVK
ncbi:MAG: PDZ domain-containing protein [Candidatus Magnetoovum sp. WYHC-5]|nr:PDZ domain-containing protein [Candidatus Magnetoovum sp. WYHC-5]